MKANVINKTNFICYYVTVKNEEDRETETIGLMTEIISLVVNQNQSEVSSK